MPTDLATSRTAGGPPERRREPVPLGQVRQLGLGTRTTMRIRHSGRLMSELSRYIVEQRLWWMVPIILCLLLVALAATATTHVVPVAVYTLF